MGEWNEHGCGTMQHGRKQEEVPLMGKFIHSKRCRQAIVLDPRSHGREKAACPPGTHSLVQETYIRLPLHL